MATTSKSTGRNLRVETVFNGQEQGEGLPPMQVYLFDRSGKLVGVEPAGKELTFPISGRQDYRLVVGPELVKDPKRPPDDLWQQLMQAKSLTKDVRALAKQELVSLAISKAIWFCWWETCITVHGTVRKLLNPGSGDPMYATICSGTVQIFQVDLGCTLDQLASFQVITLQSLLVDRLRGLEISAERLDMFRPPIPPGPLREGKSIGSGSARLNTSSLRAGSAGGSGETGAAKAAAASKKAANTFSSQFAPLTSLQVMPASSLAEAATTLSVLQGKALNQYIVANKILLWPFLCEFIPDWWFCWQELGEVPIQSDGSFWAEICFWCPDDFPDLYFEVVQNFDGVEREISDPQIACSTYYDYDGSQSVDIIVDDPEAVACLPTDGGPDYLYVEVLGLTDVGLDAIDGLNTPFSAGTGLVTWWGSSQPVPFGGTLGFNMKYHPGMFGYYYRWSYRFDGEANYTPIIAPVVHRYQQLVSVSPLTFQIFTDPLGPMTVGTTPNLYKFPDPANDWISVDNWQDLFFGFFDSTGGVVDPPGYVPADHDGVSNHKSGMCTLMLEVFDSAGNFVPCNNTPGVLTEDDQVGDPSSPKPFTYLLPSGSMYVTAPPANITDHGRLLFRIRVDNNYTVAKLPSVINATTLQYADDCGFLRFTDLANLISVNYVAREVNDFLSWELDIYRGLCGLAATTGVNNHSSPGAPVPPGAPAAFTNSCATLLGPLGSCAACDDGAAFAVNLNCWAWATNGRYAQTQYNSSATIAFALLKA
jgi:hypothetical protein